MTTDERILRLENAIAVLKDASADQQQRASAIERLTASLAELVAEQKKRLDNQEGRVSKIEGLSDSLAALATEQQKQINFHAALATVQQKQLDNHEARIIPLEELSRMLVRMARSHNEWVDKLRAAQEETDRKMAALADAQIRSEDKHARLDEAMARLAESQKHSDSRLDALVDIVREERERRKGGGDGRSQ